MIPYTEIQLSESSPVSGATGPRIPFGVTFLLDIKLAFAESIPQLDGAVTAATDDLSVISGEGNGEDIRSVANKAAGSKTSVKVPETKSVVPGRGQSELAVGRYHNVGYEMVVTTKDFLRTPVLRFVLCELPNNNCLICQSFQVRKAECMRADIIYPVMRLAASLDSQTMRRWLIAFISKQKYAARKIALASNPSYCSQQVMLFSQAHAPTGIWK
jgi:hypothetical protein